MALLCCPGAPQLDLGGDSRSAWGWGRLLASGPGSHLVVVLRPFSPLLCFLTLFFACGLRQFSRVLTVTCFSPPFGRLSGFSGHPYRVFWVQSLWSWLCCLGLCGLVCRAGFIVQGLSFLVSCLCFRYCAGLRLPPFPPSVRYPFRGWTHGVGFLSDLAWFLLLSLFACSAVPGVWVLPRLSPGLSGLVGFRFVGLALKVSFPATPNRFCLS